MTMANEAVPVVAVVGRPNVGKSTLVNRILGSRQAVVEDTPGVTRDRVAYDAIWNGRAFTLVDTGGWEPSIEGSESLAARVAAQARGAVDAADAALFVVAAPRPGFCAGWTPPGACPPPTRGWPACCAAPASRSWSRPTRSTTPGPSPR